MTLSDSKSLAAAVANLPEQAGIARRKQIAELTLALFAHGANIEKSSIASVNIGREAGLLLRDEIHGEHVRIEDLSDWIRRHPGELPHELTPALARMFLRLADRLPQPVTRMQEVEDVRQMTFEGMGLLAAPHREGPQQHVPPAPAAVCIERLCKWRVEVDELLKREPVDKWPRQRIEQMKGELRPIVELFKRLEEL
jgi:hypothetical protein